MPIDAKGRNGGPSVIASMIDELEKSHGKH
jgi:hypothetical protein